MKKRIRRGLDIFLTGLGIITIFGTVLMSAFLTVQMQLPLVLFGVLLLEAGVWGLSSKVFLNERQYLKLREEGDYIIKLIRELNASAVARDNGEEDDQRFHSTLERMHSSVNRMADMASEKAGQEEPTEQLI